MPTPDKTRAKRRHIWELKFLGSLVMYAVAITIGYRWSLRYSPHTAFVTLFVITAIALSAALWVACRPKQ